MTYEQASEKAKQRTEAGIPTCVRPVPRVPGGFGTWTVPFVVPVPTRVHWSRVHPERVRRGEQINTAKLTEQGVREIRARYVVGATTHELGRRYGVTATMISYIVKHRNWKHVA